MANHGSRGSGGDRCPLGLVPSLGLWTFRGTHLGESFGIPATGKKVEITGTATTHLKNGKIVDHLADWDALALMQQLGAVES